MVTIQYLLLLIFSIVMMIYFKPIGRYREIHVIGFGFLMVIASLLLGLIFNRNVIEMILLTDTWGPGSGIVFGYSILIGSILRILYKFHKQQ